MSTTASMLKARRRARKRQQKALKKQQLSKGNKQAARTTLPNRNSPWKTPEEEQTARQVMVEATVKVFRVLLPGLLADLAKIADPRNPRKTRHKLTVLLLYGMFNFIFQYSSRREAGREMSRPVFFENLKDFFPELESLPHQDTLCRLLEKIEVAEIEIAHINLLRRLIRNKKFVHYLVRKRYLIAIDGTQKFRRMGRNERGRRDRHQNVAACLDIQRAAQPKECPCPMQLDGQKAMGHRK